MHGLIEDFQTFNRVKNLSQSTIESYDRKLRDFAAWLDGDDPLEVSARTVRRYLSEKMTQGYKPATIRSYYDIVRAFYSFLVADEIIDEWDNPMRRLPPPKVPRQIIEPLTESQVERFLGTFDRQSVTGHRDYMMSLLVLDTGVRVAELAGISLRDIDFEIGRIRISGKGGKQRWVYVGSKAIQTLEDYINLCRPNLANGTDVLFPSSRGGAMIPRTISRIVQQHLDAAGIPRARSSAHRLRHTFATNLLRNGANVFCLQRLLGHSSLTMTRRYVRVVEQDLAEAHRVASPVDRMRL